MRDKQLTIFLVSCIFAAILLAIATIREPVIERWEFNRVELNAWQKVGEKEYILHLSNGVKVQSRNEGQDWYRCDKASLVPCDKIMLLKERIDAGLEDSKQIK